MVEKNQRLNVPVDTAASSSRAKRAYGGKESGSNGCIGNAFRICKTFQHIRQRNFSTHSSSGCTVQANTVRFDIVIMMAVMKQGCAPARPRPRKRVRIMNVICRNTKQSLDVLSSEWWSRGIHCLRFSQAFRVGGTRGTQGRRVRGEQIETGHKRTHACNGRSLGNISFQLVKQVDSWFQKSEGVLKLTSKK